MRKSIWGLTLLVVVLFLASCSKQTEYTNAIPKDAAMVVSFDFKAIAQKSGIDGKEGEKVVAKLTDALKSGLEGNALKTAEKLIQNPSESGLSLTDKVYIFATQQSSSFALLAKVSDQGKVENLLKALKDEQICEDLKEEDGNTWTKMGNALCAFNNGTFMIMANTKGDAEGIKGTVLSLLHQEAENSFTQKPDFAKLSNAKGEIAMVMDMSIIPNEVTMQMRMGLPAALKLEDIRFLVDVCFEKGKIVINSESLIENKELIASYEKQATATAPIKGDYLEYFPASTLVWVGGNIDGGRIYEILCENPTIKQSMENPMLPIDIENIFSSIHGDIAFGYNSLSTNDLLMYADVTNSAFLQSFEELRPLLAMTGGQMKLTTLGKDQYEFRMYGQGIWFGVKDNKLYITNNETIAKEAGRKYGASLQNAPWVGEVTKNRAFVAFNVAQLVQELSVNPYLASRLGVDPTTLKAVLGPCEYIDAMGADWKGGKMEIVMKNKDVNVLQLIVRGLEQL